MLSLPDELILRVTEFLRSETDVSSLSQTTRHLHSLLDPILYRRNASDSSGSALTWAATQGYLLPARKAIDAGAQSFDEAIVMAAGHSDERVMQLLLSNCHFDVARPCWRALMKAAFSGHDEVIKVLLRSEKVGSYADMVVGWEDTPLMNAAMRGHTSSVRLLIQLGRVPLNAPNRMGRTALAEAARHRHLEALKAIMEDNSADVNAEDVCGRTALFDSARRGHADTVSLLLRHPDILVENEFYSPLTYAAGKGHTEVVKLLLDSGKIDVHKKGADGTTLLTNALSWAADGGHEEVIRLLSDVQNIRSCR